LARFYFERGDVYLDLYRAGGKKNLNYFNKAVSNYQMGLELVSEDAYYHNRLGYTYHLIRRLREASKEYNKTLELDSPQPVSAEEFDLILKYAPRVYVTLKEPFALKDVTVAIHPDRPLIEYSLFWENDVAFPDDSDACDHEKVWIEYDSKSGKVIGVYTYFHEAILSTKASVKDAQRNHQRARINVQWGGHGSLPIGWEDIPPEKISARYAHIEHPIQIKDMHTRYEGYKKGIRMSNHPLAKDWPHKFEGSWEDFINFSKYVDLPKLIKDRRMVIKSRWPNAVINQYFLVYNFFPKQEWPLSLP
jgi:tetratricopeptide (TPR) repeat protein